MTAYKKKLIEVALPLEAINRESAREKSIRHGHPSTLHLWWARRPLATCRAVLFASLVDDPSALPDLFPTEEEQEAERQRLFRIIEDLVKWENSSDETVLASARAEIMRSTDGNPPPVLDPFCGGGSIPLEAQRLGLEAHGSDLNPVAVLITKALIEIPPRFADLPPVNPEAQARLGDAGWRGAQGLAEDVRYYGRWMRDEAERRVGHLYHSVTLPKEHGGGEATVIAWLWARTVRCPNPACGAEMPLVRSFALSAKKGKQAWVEPVVDAAAKTVRFEVHYGTGSPAEPTVGRHGARCLVCGQTAPLDYVRTRAQEVGLSTQLMATVAQARGGRVFLSPASGEPDLAAVAEPPWAPEGLVTTPSHDVDRLPMYGMTRWRDAFTPRQLLAMATFTDLVHEVVGRVRDDAGVESASPDDSIGQDGSSSQYRGDYPSAVATYLALGVSRMTSTLCTVARWTASREQTVTAFARQAIQMTWDFPEVNPFAGAAGDLEVSLGSVCEALERLPFRKGTPRGTASQLTATTRWTGEIRPLISTDPPYYDNVGYADLSDFFYVWLRRSLQDTYPSLFSTLLTPKTQELVASPHRFAGGKREAKEFFESGLRDAFERLREDADSDYPLTIYYAFKQAESGGDGGSATVASSGWETMLGAVLRAGYSIQGTWPMRSELGNRMIASGTNALASSIVLVCRSRSATASLATHKEFNTALREELPDALKKLQHGNIAPVDLAQASIGPGMAVFSRFSKVMEADGSQMTVRTALALINQALDEILAEQEGEFDASTRWAIAWFEQVGVQAGDFGVAETLCKAKNCSVEGMVLDGFLEAKGGKVRLLRRSELDEGWDPAADKRLTVWEMTQHLIRRLDEGEASAAALARQLGSYAEVARDLAYRLYLVCERKKWSEEAQAYNGLVVAWPSITQLTASEPGRAVESQTSMDL